MIKKALSKVKIFVAVILVSVLTLLGVEIVYRAYLNLSGKEVGSLIKYDKLLQKAWFVPHPYLVYTFKPGNSFVMDGDPGGAFTINEFGFRSTLEFDVKDTKKSKDTIRIATFGGSTTMGVNDDDKIWPYLIGKFLSPHYPSKNIEILNEGIMGYTSLDNVIDLSIRVIDFDSDIYILYLGINDYEASAPLENFRTDYSHFRKTLWENLSFSFVELTPDWLLRSKAVTSILIALGATDRKDLLDNTGTTKFRRWFKLKGKEYLEANDKIEDAIIRNITSMVGTIKSHNPDALVLLSSFYHFNNPLHIRELNSTFRQYANESGIAFVDAANLMPRVQKITYDYGHFT